MMFIVYWIARARSSCTLLSKPLFPFIIIISSPSSTSADLHFTNKDTCRTIGQSGFSDPVTSEDRHQYLNNFFGEQNYDMTSARTAKY